MPSVENLVEQSLKSELAQLRSNVNNDIQTMKHEITSLQSEIARMQEMCRCAGAEENVVSAKKRLYSETHKYVKTKNTSKKMREKNPFEPLTRTCTCVPERKSMVLVLARVQVHKYKYIL